MLVHGVHMIVWPRRGWPDPSRLVADLLSLGCAGVVPQASLMAPAWVGRYGKTLESAGLQVTVGLGFDGHHSAQELSDAVVAGLDVARHVEIDWEEPKIWEVPSGQQRAAGIVHDALQRRPDAHGRITHTGWWAPFTLPNGHLSHPGAPTGIFTALCAEVFPQCYAEHDGHPDWTVAEKLAWAVRQYASVGLNVEVYPTYQLYDRTVRECVDEILAVSKCLGWDYQEMQPNVRLALTCVRKMREAGCVGPTAVRDYQEKAGLTVDGVFGDQTFTALQVTR